MRISEKLLQAHSSNSQLTNGNEVRNNVEGDHGNGGSTATYSFEFFVPKTSQGVQNLYDRMDRMYELSPLFIDITWNAGGRLSNLTCEMVSTSQSIIGLETCMHLTCTGMPRKLVEDALKNAYDSGCNNILALRGDPPHMSEKWTSVDGGFSYAKDLVKYIRSNYGNHFDIGVAGYPEGHPEESDPDVLIPYLKEKCDAGADFVITQMFYDVDNFISWVAKCRQAGITVPIIPGIMPISTYASFMRRATWCQINIPKDFLNVLEPIKGDDVLVRDTGARLVAEMCQKIVDSGINHLHFYTMNLEKATVMVLDRLGLLKKKDGESTPPALPWRQSLAKGREEETVRPIFWKNRKHSYVARTQDWDEFPNGRWGDSRSPAYGDLETYGVLLRQSASKAIDMWDSPTTIECLGELFVKYINGQVKSLPWSDSPISSEIDSIKANLVDLNSRGFLTINSQPAVNGVKSSHPVHGWGPANGYVYQKAYLELLVPPNIIDVVLDRMKHDPEITFYAVNRDGALKTNAPSDGPNAVTWGIFPGKEVIQPTVVEKISFLAWKDEAFRLASEWAYCFPEDSLSRAFIESIANSWYLINIVHNDFQDPEAIFKVFEKLNANEN